MAIIKSVLVEATTQSTSFVRNYTEKYLVSTDGPTTDLRSIVEYKGSPGLAIPKYGAEFDGDSIAVVLSKSATPTDSTRTQFVVSVEYGPYENAGHNHTADEFSNPLDAPPEYTWGYSSRQEVVTQTLFQGVEVPILNTAGDQFIPAVEKTVYDLQLTVVQNVEDFRPVRSRNLVGTVNKKEFSVAGIDVPVKSSLVTERSATSEVFEDVEADARIEYWTVTTVMVFRDHNPLWVAVDGLGNVLDPRNAWYKRILNAGLDQLGDDGKQHRITIDSQEVTEPKLLTVAGLHEPVSADAVWIGAEIYKTADHGKLAL